MHSWPGCLPRAGSCRLSTLPGAQTGLPKTLWKQYLALAVVPPNTPLPLGMLRLLWASDTVEEVLATSSVLARAGVLRMASLQDQSTWALVQPEHVTALAVRS